MAPSSAPFSDNLITFQNNTVDGNGLNGEAAIRFLDNYTSPNPHGTERAALGYSSPSSQYYPKSLYLGIGNPFATSSTDTSDTNLIINNEHGANSPYFPSTTYTIFKIFSQTGIIQTSDHTGNPVTIMSNESTNVGGKYFGVFGDGGVNSNAIYLKGAANGSAPILNVYGPTDATVPLHIQDKAGGGVFLDSNGAQVAGFSNPASANASLLVRGAAAGNPVTLTAYRGGSAADLLLVADAGGHVRISGGLMSLASSTVGDSTQVGGLTISGGATTTGNAYFAGNVGIGTQGPVTNLDVFGKGVFGNGTTIRSTLSTFPISVQDTGANMLRLTRDSIQKVDFRINTTPNRLDLVDTDHSSITPLSVLLNGTGNVGIGTSSPTAQLHTTGTVRFSNFGAGSLQTDANGNVSVSSDERLKHIDGNFTRGLADVLAITPINYHWNEASGLDTKTQYSGFSAQNVQAAIPEAVGVSPNGYLSLNDRPVLAAVVNAIKEIASKLDTLATSVSGFAERFTTGELFARKARIDELCVGSVCVTEQQFLAMAAAGGSYTITTSNQPAPPPEQPATSTATSAPAADVETDAHATSTPLTDTQATSTPSTDFNTQPPVLIEDSNPFNAAPANDNSAVQDQIAQ